MQSGNELSEQEVRQAFASLGLAKDPWLNCETVIADTATLGFTSAPGFFAVFGKAVRFLHRNGGTIIGAMFEAFHMFQWVDDLIAVEADIGERLERAEVHLKWAVTSIFGNVPSSTPWDYCGTQTRKR